MQDIIKIITGFLKVSAVLYLGIAIFAFLFAENIIFIKNVGKPFDEMREKTFRIPTPDGGWICAKYFLCPDSKWTVIYSHGNGESVADMAYLGELYNKHGYSFLVYDYRGYGGSSGKSSVTNACEDIEVAYEYLTKKIGVPPEQIILHGFSLGGGVSAHLASKRKVGALILDSTFVSAFRVVLPIRILPFDFLETKSKLSVIKCPVFVIHGDRDEIISFRHAKELYETAKEPKAFLAVKGATHGEAVLLANESFWEKLKSLLETR